METFTFSYIMETVFIAESFRDGSCARILQIIYFCNINNICNTKNPVHVLDIVRFMWEKNT